MTKDALVAEPFTRAHQDRAVQNTDAGTEHPAHPDRQRGGGVLQEVFLAHSGPQIKTGHQMGAHWPRQRTVPTASRAFVKTTGSVENGRILTGE